MGFKVKSLNLIKDERGQAITEYALIIALIVLVVIVVISGLGTKLVEVFQSLIDQL